MSRTIDHNEAMAYVNNMCEDLDVDEESQDAMHGALQEWLLDNDDVDEFIVHSSIAQTIAGNDFVKVTALGTTADDELFHFRVTYSDSVMQSAKLILAPALKGVSSSASSNKIINPNDAYKRAMRGIC